MKQHFCGTIQEDYAWSAGGSKAVIKRPGIRGRAHSLLLCVSSNGVVQWQLNEGAVNALRFSEFLAHLRKHSKLVLDNAVIHHATSILAKQGLPTVPEVAQSWQIRQIPWRICHHMHPL